MASKVMPGKFGVERFDHACEPGSVESVAISFGADLLPGNEDATYCMCT